MAQRIAFIGSDAHRFSAIKIQICKFHPNATSLDFGNGFDFIKHCLQSKYLPEIVFLEIFLLKIDGIALTDYITEYIPGVRVVIVDDQLDKNTITHISEVGAKAFIYNFDPDSTYRIDSAPEHGYKSLKISFQDIFSFSPEYPKSRLSHKNAIRLKYKITKREALFLLLNATGLEYSEIASLMFISRKTVDNLFNSVAKKMVVRNRHNLTLFCLRIGLVKIAIIQPYTTVS